MGGGVTTGKHGICLGRNIAHHPDHPRLYVMVLLRVQGQADRRGGLPLMVLRVSSTIRRLGWMIIIWAASVLGLGVVAGAFRVLMSYAGLTT